MISLKLDKNDRPFSQDAIICFLMQLEYIHYTNYWELSGLHEYLTNWRMGARSLDVRVKLWGHLIFEEEDCPCSLESLDKIIQALKDYKRGPF